MSSRLTIGDVIGVLQDGVQIDIATPISRAVIDSREAGPGALFVALKGEQVDGHTYVNDAIERGAVVAIIDQTISTETPVIDLRKTLEADAAQQVEPPVCLRVEDSLTALQGIAKHWRRELDARVIGITGSVGKSTTKELTAEVLEAKYQTIRNPGNLNNEIGLPLSMLSLSHEDEHAVLEMGFYVPGEIALLCDIAQPQVGVVTNVSHVHMERAGSMEAIVEGKGELVEALPPDPDGVAILNYDDPLVRGMAERTKAKVFYYGLEPDADIWASEVEGMGLEGVHFVLHYQGEAMHLRVPLLGRHSVHTALRAAAVGFVEGLTWQEIIRGLSKTHNQLRLVAVQGPRGSLLLDDTYNAAPTSVMAALNLLEDLEGRKIAVLGDMLELGDYEERGHRLVGARAAKVVDQLVTVGTRARWIAEEAVAAGLSSGEIIECETSGEAIEYLEDKIDEEDVVLVKGSRGMRMDLIVAALEVEE
jgi:UDP-N-acetylmuramoyl-tripeptide--D-alanyl-D-alanine ligase